MKRGRLIWISKTSIIREKMASIYKQFAYKVSKSRFVCRWNDESFQCCPSKCRKFEFVSFEFACLTKSELGQFNSWHKYHRFEIKTNAKLKQFKLLDTWFHRISILLNMSPAVHQNLFGLFPVFAHCNSNAIQCNAMQSNQSLYVDKKPNAFCAFVIRDKDASRCNHIYNCIHRYSMN